MSGPAIRRPKPLKWAALGLIALILAGHRTPLVVWNATASAPIGLYLSMPIRRLTRGDLVLAMPPPDVAQFAASRGYLPRGVPLVKHVEALQGDTICAIQRDITIDGRQVARRLVTDGAGRALPHWQGCRTLKSGQVFLLMPGVRDSFDGRYFGPISRKFVLARLVPLCLR